MKRFIVYSIVSLVSILLTSVQTKAGDKIEFSNEFNMFTSKNLEGYLKPLFTSIEEGINSNLFSTAYYKDAWSIGLDISVSGMFIPNSQTTYNAERPEEFGNTGIVRTAEWRDGEILTDYTGGNIQPTIYGGHSTSIYAARQNAWYPDSVNKTIGSVEGNDISFMSGLPTVQLTVGLPSRTEVRLRYLSLNVSGSPLTYWGVAAAQRIDQFFNLFDTEQNLAVAVNVAYSQITRDAGLDINTFAVGAFCSKWWDNGLTLYAGLQYENMGGKFEAVRDKSSKDELNDSPYKEIREMQDLSIDISSFTNFRLTGGISYKIGFLELHADAAWASQPILTAGLRFIFAEWGNSVDIERENRNKIKREQNTQNK